MPSYVQQLFMEGQNLVKNGNRLLNISPNGQNNQDTALLVPSVMVCMNSSKPTEYF